VIQVAALLEITRDQIARGEATSVVPFNAITLPFTLQEILDVARLHSAKMCKEVQRIALNASQLRVSNSSALRVGYLSADFRHIHPVGRDLAAILPRHTHRFELSFAFLRTARYCVSQPQQLRRVRSLGYAINPPRVNDSSRETVVKRMGKFTRVDDMVDAQVCLLLNLQLGQLCSSVTTQASHT
jgi:hypothetical protein